jgi:hypothetical protein
MLVTNGCSFVWGDELEGFDNDPPTHWHSTFTHQLAEKLGVEYVNLSTCGASNHKIFRDTMKYIRCNPKPDYMVILWSAWQRFEHCEPKTEEEEKQILKIERWGSMTQASPERTSNINEKDRPAVTEYVVNHKSIRHDIVVQLDYMVNMQYICEMKGIKLLQGVFHERMKRNLMSTFHPKHHENNWTPWMDVAMSLYDELKLRSKIGLHGSMSDLYSLAKSQFDIKPYGHPDEAAHTEYANLLYHWFHRHYNMEK